MGGREGEGGGGTKEEGGGEEGGWKGRGEEKEAEPIRGSLTWTRVRRTRKGRRWERKTDR